MKDAIPFYRVVCAILYHPDQSGRILAARRLDSDPALPGKWEFPGGKVETDESESEALVREIREELGIQVEVRRRLSPSRWTYPGFRIELIPYVCESDASLIQSNEHSDVRWCDRRELDRLDWAPADIPIVREILQGDSPQ